MIYIASLTNGKGKVGRDASIARPPKIHPGDVLVAALGYTSTDVFVEPQNVWRSEESLEYSGIGLSLYLKIAGEDEPDSYDWTGLKGDWVGMVFNVCGCKQGEVHQNIEIDAATSRMLWSPSLDLVNPSFVVTGVLSEGSLYSPVPEKGLRAPHVNRVGRTSEGLTMSVTTTDKSGGGISGPWSWCLPEVTKHIGWSIAFSQAESSHEKPTPIKEKRIGLRRN